jgi:phosphoribosylanthranilate isomerase
MNVHAVDVNSGVEDSPGHKIITHVEAVIGIFSS